MILYKHKGTIKQVTEGKFTGCYYWELYNFMNCVASGYDTNFEMACAHLMKAFIGHSRENGDIRIEIDDNIYKEYSNDVKE